MISMRTPDAKTATGLSEPEERASFALASDDLVGGDSTGRHGVREDQAHAQTTASLRLLWESRRFLGRVIGISLLVSTLIAFLIPKRYQSAARLMPPDNQSGSGLALAAATLSGGMGELGGMAGDLLGLRSSSDLLVGVIGSRTVEDKLIQKFDLKAVYGDRRMEDTRRDLAARTGISVDRKNQITTITVTDKIPQRATAMVQAYIDELNSTLAEVSTSSARRERIFLEGRLRSVNQDLEASEIAFSQFASKNQAIDIKEQGKAMVDAAANLQGQYIAARSELEGLRQLYADNNIRVRSAQARLAELENQLMKVAGKNNSSGLEQEDSLYPSIRKLPLLGVTYADLYRKTRVEEAVFETLTKQYELAKVQEAKEIPTVKVLDPPNFPEKKSFPPRLPMMLLGTLLAGLGAVTWVLGNAAWQRRDRSDPGVVLAQEVLTSIKSAIPWVSQNGSKPRGKSDAGVDDVDPTRSSKD
jgi:uncharacterized protein involved in exopolysaccharide biosynthesis